MGAAWGCSGGGRGSGTRNAVPCCCAGPGGKLRSAFWSGAGPAACRALLLPTPLLAGACWRVCLDAPVANSAGGGRGAGHTGGAVSEAGAGAAAEAAAVTGGGAASGCTAAAGASGAGLDAGFEARSAAALASSLTCASARQHCGPLTIIIPCWSASQPHAHCSTEPWRRNATLLLGRRLCGLCCGRGHCHSQQSGHA